MIKILKYVDSVLDIYRHYRHFFFINIAMDQKLENVIQGFS